MATNTVIHIGAGRDYATLQTFATAMANRDLVANNEIITAYVHDNEVITASFTVMPKTYSASCYIKIMPAPGAGVMELDTSGALDYGTVGVEWQISSTYGLRFSHGVWVFGMRMNLKTTSTVGPAVYLARNANSSVYPNAVFDCRITHCRIKHTAGWAGINSNNFISNSIFEDNLMFCEVVPSGTAGFPFINGQGTLQRNTFVGRSAGAGLTAVKNGSTTSVYRDNVFAGCGGKPIDLTTSSTGLTNNFTDTTLTTAVSGIAYVANLITSTADARPADSSALIGAATDYAINTVDIRNGFRGTDPDAGVVMKVAAALPAKSDATITSVTTLGQSVTISGTYTNTPTSGTATLTPAATPNGATTASGQVAFGNGQFSITIRGVTPGNYAIPSVIMSNIAGAGVSSGGSAFTLAMPAVPTITVTAQEKTTTTVSFSGTLTGYPVSGSVTLVPSATNPNGATAKTAPLAIVDEGQTWSVTITSNTPGNYDPPTFIVTNAAGSGTASGKAYSVYAAGQQPPGLPAVDLPAYSTPVFNAPTVADGVTITTLTIDNTSAASVTNQPFTVGMPFKQGQLKKSDSLIGKISGQADLPLQFDVKATWNDGSIRHGIISGILPSISGSASVAIGIARKVAVRDNTPLSPSSIVSAAVNAVMTINIAGTVYTADLNAALTANTKLKQWLAGPVCTEYTVEVPFLDNANVAHPLLTAYFAIRYFSSLSKAKVDFCIENTNAYGNNLGDVTYTVNCLLAGLTVYSKTDLKHFTRARWKKSFWTGAEPVIHTKHEVNYVLDTKMVPNYQRDLVFTEAKLTQVELINPAWSFEPMTYGPFLPGQTITGGRPDIGINPAWHTVWLLTQDKRFKDTCTKGCDIYGSWSCHTRDRSTGPGAGYPMSVINWPYSSYIGTNTDSYNPSTGQQERLPDVTSANQSTPDVSHHPQACYLPYLLCGEYYYLEELHFWQTFCSIKQLAGYRDYHKSVFRQEQVRGQGWANRDTFMCAAITPDDHPLKMHFRYMADQNMAYYNSQYTDNPSANKVGLVVNGYAIGYTVDNDISTGLSPWMQDFLTQSFGFGGDLGFSEAWRFVKWMGKFNVGRMLAPGYCWAAGSVYVMKVRPDQNSPFYETMAQIYNATYPTTTTSQGCATQGWYDSLKTFPTSDFRYQNINLGEMVGYPGTTRGYPANYQPALAYTVDSGAADADLAWDQFESRANHPDYGTGPTFAIVPRTYVATPVEVTPPTAPQNVTATLAGVQATVSFDLPISTGGAPIDYFVVTASTGETQQGTSSPINVTMIVGHTATFTVKAHNSAGLGTASSPSNPITVTSASTPPGAPTGVTLTAGDGTITINFVAPTNDGGKPITSYVITTSGNATKSVTASPTTMIVPNDVPVSAKVHAVNEIGAGPDSDDSNVVVPTAPIVIHSVTISPKTIAMNGSTQQQFASTVDYSGNANGGVSYSCSLGTISSAGLYTAPPGTNSLQTATVTSTSLDDPTVKDVATITILAVDTGGGGGGGGGDPTPTPTKRLRSYNAVVRTKTGNAVEGAYVLVFDQTTLEKAVLYKDANKVEEIHNPLTSDENGFFEFFVDATQCGYTVSGFGIEPYTRNNIFDIATSIDLSPIQASLLDLQASKASIAALNNLAASKASIADLNALANQVQDKLSQLRPTITVNNYVTGGTGTLLDPWTGWATGIDWQPFTQYDFLDGYYAYTESPNFAKNYLKLNTKAGTFIMHTGTLYALLCDAGSTNEFVVGVDIKVNLIGNTNSNGGIYLRACAYSNIDATFYDVPGACLQEYSTVLNKYRLVRSPITSTQTIRPSSIVQSFRRTNSIQCSNNEYNLICEGALDYAALMQDCVNSQFNGNLQLGFGGLSFSNTCSGNTVDNLYCNGNDAADIACAGSYNTFNNVISSSLSTFTGNGNVIRGGKYDRIINGGNANYYGPLTYSYNGGLFSDGGTNIVKRSVTNLTTKLVDEDVIPALRDLTVSGKTVLSTDTLNVGNGQIFKDPNGKVGIGQTTFVNDSPLQITNNNNTTTAEGLRVNLAGASSLAVTAKLANFNTAGSDVCTIFGNGNVQNLNNSYGAISDVRYKENIVAATPKLSKLLQVNVVNYNLTGQNEKLLGVISQELGEVFPGMIETVPVLDENGVQVDDYKAVKYSVFIPILIQSVQELAARVKALEEK